MDGIDWMAGAMRAARMRLDVAANNLANVSTDGFRKAQTEASLTSRGIVITVRTAPSQGALRHTGAPFDLAIVGGRQTRLGSFTPDRDGYLADAKGRRLLGTHGAVHVDGQTTIAADGSVRRDGREVNRLPLPSGSSLRS